MSEQDAIIEALVALGEDTAIQDCISLAGGCIDRIYRLRRQDKPDLVAKVAPLDARERVRAEQAGMSCLSDTGHIRIPRSYLVHASGSWVVHLMEYLPSCAAGKGEWKRFGTALGAMHRHPGAEAYGFYGETWLGTTMQPNAWHTDWPSFYAEQRIGYQLNLGKEDGVLGTIRLERLLRVRDRLPSLLPPSPVPATCHGDLWSGNALPYEDEEGLGIALVDPACSYGDGWTDIAMMHLFGGFPGECYDAYARGIGEAEPTDGRILVYQLYHLLNHVHLFGGGYLGQVDSILDRLSV